MRRLMTFLLLLFLSVSAYAQPVHIPDPNLHAVVREALKLPADTAITQDDMNRLTHLTAYSSGIIDLTGLDAAGNLRDLVLGDNPLRNLFPLENLTNLRRLIIHDCGIGNLNSLSRLSQLEVLNVRNNPISDLTPLAGLTALKGLDLSQCSIIDISPLESLVNLEALQLNDNQITDVRPISQLTSLRKLELQRNQIIDVRPLSTLTSLRHLELQQNQITDHAPIDSLSLDTFFYDQYCEMPPLPLEPRLANRHYPSIISRWAGLDSPPISNRPILSATENIGLHDLWFTVHPFHLTFSQKDNEFSISGKVNKAIRLRDNLLAFNPNIVILVDIGMRAAPLDWFPEDWPYWIKDEQGKIFREVSHDEHAILQPWGLMDFTHPYIQDRIVQQAIAVSKCGLYDGIFFDFWAEEWRVLGGWDGTQVRFFRTLEQELQAREAIIQRIRAETRPNFLIMGNTNHAKIPRTSPYVNGGFMESVVPHDNTGAVLKNALSEIEDTLLWFENNLREPRIPALEGWSIPSEPADSPANLRWMRAITALSLTHSNGYTVFHRFHGERLWYDFWDADLGRPVGEKGHLYQDTDGLYIREFTNGWAVYNHSGAAQVITLPEEAEGVASGLVNTEHTLPNLDGEMYLRVKPADPADVNGDGVVNILDLTIIARDLGTDNLEGDVNGDGVVNILDLVEVAAALEGGAAAPSADSPELSNISDADVAKWLALAQGLDLGDANFQRGIRFLEGLLAALTPKETTLLPNYPNPFNPETWIPYRLAREAEVAIAIYDTKGTLVRRLALGNQPAGHYAERGKAAYWDGRNEDGEAVASGIYIYQFRAGDYAASRRMVIVK